MLSSHRLIRVSCSSMTSRSLYHPFDEDSRERADAIMSLLVSACVHVGFRLSPLQGRGFFSWWSCSLSRACCATLAPQSECSRLLRAHHWNLPCRGDAQHCAGGHLKRVHLEQVHDMLWQGSEGLWNNFFLSRVFPELGRLVDFELILCRSLQVDTHGRRSLTEFLAQRPLVRDSDCIRRPSAVATLTLQSGRQSTQHPRVVMSLYQWHT